ncbi:hypothetical protein THICB1_30135 [Thiomonas arsenitoxydans]|uniref:Uncharacterized protein n=1 Tax=Thiomonas arsenitoxydans (strain DSM 22701 / CIP 110005 / 3As) TaxID=426114 RepID=A0ABP1Z336_THIA3|nr:hypothetical protein THICB1_30135 [Thiomonas arsenitoxydans]CQR33503.1 hypothetical protein ACO3_370070 [Thiomonas arsenitoxydans]CQR39889.1 hypothetical protein THICB6_80136 [Thiomonas arsenitoxydans]
MLRGNPFTRQFTIGHCLQGADRAGFGALGKGRHHRGMRHIARIAAVERGHMLQRIEVFAPMVGNRTGIGEIALVHLFDIRGIAAEEIGIGFEFLHQHMRSQSAGHPGAQWENILPRLGLPDWRIAALEGPGLKRVWQHSSTQF